MKNQTCNECGCEGEIFDGLCKECSDKLEGELKRQKTTSRRIKR